MMNQPIKITTAEGITIELANVDQLSSVMPLLTGATVRVDVPPIPAPAKAEPRPEATAAPRPTRHEKDATPAHLFDVASDLPDHVFLSERESRVLNVVRAFKDGITTPEVAELLNMTVSQTGLVMWNLRTTRPVKDTTNPLIQKISNGRFRCTDLGATVQVRIDRRPMPRNRAIHWT